MFPNTANSFHQKQLIAQKKFDTHYKKGQMEKNTDQVILGMAVF